MLTGFNTDVDHRGLRFHVQTEDSGLDRPHVISHVFFEGAILSSRKSDYAAELDAADLEARVRELMEAQHREMIEGLERGELDPVIDERVGGRVGGSLGSTNPVPPFGEGIVSRKPLDEVILDHLVAKSRLTHGNG
ncbi:hypothetical protein MK489_04545 [Myxococcota bacterium]|nr:hypothetical protein [Myxococcota bacterium]